MLAMTHLSNRYAPREFRREAEREFPRAVVVRDFDQIEIPFAERGEPTLHSLRDSRRRQERAGAEADAGGAPSDAPATLRRA
jgi:hypothetical protein